MCKREAQRSQYSAPTGLSQTNRHCLSPTDSPCGSRMAVKSPGGPHLSGHPVGMKTAVSLPDDPFAEAERYGQSHQLSRSALYARALSEYLIRHSDDAITAAN